MKKRLLLSACFAFSIAATAFAQNIPGNNTNDDELIPGTHDIEHTWNKRTHEEESEQPAGEFDYGYAPTYILTAPQASIQKYKNDNALAISKPLNLHAQSDRIRSGIFSPEYFLFTK